MSRFTALLRLSFALLLTQVSVTVSRHRNGCSSKRWPCPVAENIAPCVCSSDENFNLFLDCSEAKNTEELANAFKGPFPFNQFYSLTIDQTGCEDCQLTSLPAGVLGDSVTFSEVTIAGTQIEVIEDETFNTSRDTLVTLRLTSNSIRSFPFESIGSYRVLKYLHLNRNLFDDSNPIPNLNSEILTIVNLSSNDIVVSPELVTNSPVIKHVRLRNIGLTEVPLFDESPIGMFTGLQKIELIDFGENFLTEIQTDTIIAEASTLKTVDFSRNDINILQPGFVTGFSTDESATLIMSYNSITYLDQQVWEDILMELPHENSVDLSENPLECDCNMAWLVQSPLKASLTNTTTCEDGTIIKFIEEDDFLSNCELE